MVRKKKVKKGVKGGKKRTTVRYDGSLQARSMPLPVAVGAIQRGSLDLGTKRDRGFDVYGPITVPQNATNGQIVARIEMTPASWLNSRASRITAPYQQFVINDLRLIYTPYQVSAVGCMKFIYVIDPDDTVDIGASASALLGCSYMSMPVYAPAEYRPELARNASWFWLLPQEDTARITMQGAVYLVWDGPTVTGSDLVPGKLDYMWDISYRYPAPPVAAPVTVPIRGYDITHRAVGTSLANVQGLASTLVSKLRSVGIKPEQLVDIVLPEAPGLNKAFKMALKAIDIASVGVRSNATFVNLDVQKDLSLEHTSSIKGTKPTVPTVDTLYMELAMSRNGFTSAEPVDHPIYIYLVGFNPGSDHSIQFKVETLNSHSRSVLYTTLHTSAGQTEAHTACSFHACVYCDIDTEITFAPFFAHGEADNVCEELRTQATFTTYTSVGELLDFEEAPAGTIGAVVVLRGSNVYARDGRLLTDATLSPVPFVMPSMARK